VDEFERLSLKAFMSSDMLGRGCLDENEVVAALRSPVLGLGLTKDDVRARHPLSLVLSHAGFVP